MKSPHICILPELCQGCGVCVGACPFGAIAIRDGKAFIDANACTLCGACVSACRKFEAIRMSTPARQRRTSTGDVWVFCEFDQRRQLAMVSRELLGLATDLAATLGVQACAVLCGVRTATPAAQAIAAGADRVYAAEHRRLAHYDDERFAAIVARLVRRHRPGILLGGATTVGRALLPRVAVLVHTGLTADCTELRIDPESGLLLQTRPAFGGNILATIACEKHRPQMATVRPGVLPLNPIDPQRRGQVVYCELDPADLFSHVKLLNFTPRPAHDSDLRQAKIIVAAGAGAGGPEGVQLIARLAQRLGGALGASRPVVDAGWLSYPHQVGQTGITVQPQLYIACGISGAIQHLVGMQSSETIIAINRDADAPIFAHADIGVAGDLCDILSELLRALDADTLKQVSAGQPATE